MSSTASAVSRSHARRCPGSLSSLLEGVVLLLAILLFATQANGAGPGPVVESPAQVAAEKAAPRHASDRVLVRFVRGAPHAQRDAALQRAGVRVKQHFARSGVSVLRIADKKQSVEQTIRRLEASGAVEYAVPDQLLRALDTFPNDPEFSALYGLHNAGQTGGTPDADIDAPEAWDVTTGDASIVVGVIDTGIDYTHPDLATNMWRNPGEVAGNGLDDDANGYVDDVFGIDCVNDDGDPFDDHYHGTHVAGTIGARGNDGIGVAGVNWNVGLMALKFLDAGGGGWTSDAVECLEYATRMRAEYGVDVRLTSNSWGGGGFDPALRDAIAASGQAGMLFVAAAGNAGSDNDAFPAYPASYDLPHVVSVAATDHRDALASFSSFGLTAVDLGAPGVDVFSTMPGNDYSWLSGTSMATPHVSGAAALVWSAFPSMAPLDLKQLLMGTGDDASALAGRTVSGKRLNVASALTCEGALDLVTHPDAGFRVALLAPVRIEVGLRDCGMPILGVSASITTPDGVLSARDDGTAPDAVANDGTLTASWTPQAVGDATLSVEARLGSESFHEDVSGSVFEETVYRSQGAAFRWIDTSAGADTGLRSDDAWVEIPIGFAFPFYGETHEQVKVSTNGYLAFAGSPWHYWNQPMPALSEPNGVIAPYWDDLDPTQGGSIRYLLDGQAPNRRLTVEWSQVRYFGDAATVTFQVTLFENGRIRFQYQDIEAGYYGRGASATVGIENVDGTLAFLHSLDSPSVGNGTALVIREAMACNDGRDNDGDGLVDFPQDPECRQEWGASETPGSCGLLGIELLLVAPFAAWRRRSRTRRTA